MTTGTDKQAQFARYANAFRALRSGTFGPTDVRTVIRYQAEFAGVGARAAGSPVVDEDREWRQHLASLR